MQPSDEQELSYYAVLNVPRDAPQEDIKKAYRALAQVFHPDKHKDLDLRTAAQESFAKLQDAYEVLADPNKRQIYDVYGKQGLLSGMELGEKLKSTEELKAEFREFRAKQERAREEALTNHRGYYQCRLDGRTLLQKDSKAPLLRTVVVQNSIDIPATDSDFFHIQGQAALKGHIGSGSIVCGYKRIISSHDQLEGSVVLGLRSLLTCTSTRQLSQYSQAYLTTTYSAQDGMGMQVGLNSQVFQSTHGSLGWVVGPRESSGMNVSLVHRGEKYTLTGKVDVGALTAITGRVAYMITDSTQFRVVVRLGMMGVDVEVGLSKRFSPHSSGGMSTVVGLQGIVLKVRYSRGGQTFEVPVLISQDFRNLKVLGAAYILPPLTWLILTRYVVRPLRKWHQKRLEREAQLEYAEEIWKDLDTAYAEVQLLRPVAVRKVRSEAQAGGLVLIEGAYGSLEAYREAWTSSLNGHDPAGGEPSCAPQEGASTSSQGQGHGRDVSARWPSRNGYLDPPLASPFEQGANRCICPPPRWMDVTSALQYLVAEGTLKLYPGVSKKGLMGFADPQPQGDKHLCIAFAYKKTLYEVVIGDLEGVILPDGGLDNPIKDPQREAYLQQRAVAQGLDWKCEMMSDQRMNGGDHDRD